MYSTFKSLAGSVADPHHVDADPDPTFHFDADPNPDPTFQFDADQCGSGSTTLLAGVLLSVDYSINLA